MATKKGKDQRERIIKEALACIHKHGLFKTNAALITKKLRIPQSLFFYYFPKQSQLFLALVESIVATNRQIMAAMMEQSESQTPWDLLVVYIKTNIAWAEQFPSQVSVLVYGVIDTAAGSDMQDLVKTSLQGGEDRIYSLIVEGLALKQFELVPRIDPRNAARSIHQQIIGSIIHFNAFREDETTQLKDYVIRCVTFAAGLLRMNLQK